jgi:hypothetical protein
LAEAFKPANVAELKTLLEESHDDGLMLDMRGFTAEKIEEAWATVDAHDAAKSVRN